MKRVVLAGGAGFIGHNLAVGLRRAGHKVMVLDNLMWNNITDNVLGGIDMFRRELYHRFLMQRFDRMRAEGVELHNADARLDMSSFLDDFHATDIVHMAAISSAVEARKNPGLCFDLQLVTLKNVLEYAKNKGTRVTFMSSSTVYGDFETEIVDETTRPRPKGIYANAKYMGERLCRTYSDQYGIDSIIIRPSALYGERCVSGRVSQKFIENALQGLPLSLEGGGQGKLDFTHISDLVDGIIKALERAPKGTNTYNLTYGKARTIKELAEVVNQVVPCRLEITPKNDLAPERGTLSGQRARMELGFNPYRGLESGYLTYCKWYKEQWLALQKDRSRTNPESWRPDANEAIQAGLSLHPEPN